MKANFNSLNRALFITVLLMAGLLSIQQVYAQDWLDTDWQYRREVTIANPGGTELTDYQVKIILNSSFDFSKANTDGSDVRFTSNDGTSLLSFWIEDWNDIATRAVIWLKIPTIPIGGTTVFLYYGNSGATTLSDGKNTFHAYDGFESYDLGTVPVSDTENPGEWTRYAGNPILGPGSPGSWDDGGATFASVIIDDEAGGEYRMYYHGYSGSTHQVGLATSPDGLTWTRYPGNPVLPPGPAGSWDAQQTRVPMVWKEGPGDYHMIYTGRGTASGQVGYATSTDGINWTKHPSNPVFNDPTWAHNQTENWGVMKVGSEYQMWYSTWGQRQSGIAVSTDLVNWTPHTPGPIFVSNGIPSSDRYSQFCPSSFKFGSYYYVLVPSYSSVSNYAKFYLYRSSSPYFPEADRHLVRVAHTSLVGDIDEEDNDTPYVLTLDIERTIFPNNELWLYYAAKAPGTGWQEGLCIEIDIASALSDALLPGENGLNWGSPSGSVAVVAAPVRQGAKSLNFTNTASIIGSFSALPQGVIGSWLYRTSTSNGDVDIYLYGGAALSCVAGLGRNGTFHFWDGAFNESTTSWSINTWYLVTLAFNGTTNQYDFIVYDEYLNEIVNEPGINYGNPTATITDGMLYTSSEYIGEAYADDYRVRILTNPEPLITLGDEENQNNKIDIAVYNTTCGDFEVVLRPNTDIANTLTNIQFTVKWPESTVALTDITSTYGVALQGSVIIEGGENHAVFVSSANIPITWVAGTEYTILSFSHDQSNSGYADFEIDTLSWAAANNGEYYVELLGLDYTGMVYNNALNVYLGMCGNIKVMLQAPYSGSGLMNKGLAGNIPLVQPYGGSPWNYIGTEELLEIDTNAVDWVLLELRSDPLITIEKKAALLLDDGSIVQYNNTSQGVHFDNTVEGSSYFIVVHHRNHMPVMTAALTVFDGTLVDFTDEIICYGTPNAEIELETDIFGLIAGDVNSNGNLSYSGLGNDRGPILAKIVYELGTTDINDTIVGYFDEDVLMDYQVKYIGTNNDRATIITNLGILTGTNYLNAVYQSVVPGVTTKSGSINDGPINIFLDETKNELQVKITTDEDIQNGIVDNVQFTLSWEVASDNIIVPILENAQSSFGLMPQGDATLFEGRMYQTFVSVLPVGLPNPFSDMDEVVLVSFTKNQPVTVSTSIGIADNAYTSNHNGDYYISLLGKDFTGNIHSSSLGIADIQDAGLSIYPNPVTSGIIHVEMNLEKAQEVTITLMDVQGKIVNKHKLKVNKGLSNNQIDLHHLTKGIYYIKVQADNLNAMRKLILL